MSGNGPLPRPTSDGPHGASGADRSGEVLITIAGIVLIFVISSITANGLVNSDRSPVGSGLFSRTSDAGGAAWLIAIALSFVFAVMYRLAGVGRSAFRHRKTASAALAARFKSSDRDFADGHGRTGAGHFLD